MDRRQFNSAALTLLCGGIAQRAGAQGLAGLSNQDATQGLRAALERGAGKAVEQLGRQDGFLGNERVRIPLPAQLADAAGLLRSLGQGRRLDELELAMNRAAEKAVPMAKPLLINAVKNMSVSDAKQILAGGDDSVTQFFAGKTRTPLGEQFLPVVSQATAQVGLAEKYNRVAGRAAKLGLLKPEQASIEQYVTGKTLDGLYWMIGEEERKIRQDPIGTGSALLQKVFGALR